MFEYSKCQGDELLEEILEIKLAVIIVIIAATYIAIISIWSNHYHRSITAKAAIDEYTIMQLKLILRNSSQNIKEIAWEFSFSSQPFFCEYFRRHTGMTPQQWREGK